MRPGASSSGRARPCNGATIDPRLGRISFSAWATEWERTTVDLRPTTVDLYQCILRSFLLPTFGPVPMGRIAPLEVRAWLADLAASDVSAASAHRAFRLLRRIMNVAVQSEVIARSPCTGMRPPQVPRNEMRFCTPEEDADLAEVVDPGYRCLVLTAAYTGLRWGELAGLKRKRVDLLHRALTVTEQLTELNGDLRFAAPKTDAGRRRVKLSPFLVEQLQGQLDERAQPGRMDWCSSRRKARCSGAATSAAPTGSRPSAGPGSTGCVSMI